MADPIATYTFLPWLRQGLASAIGQEDTLGETSPLVDRAEVTVAFDVNALPVSNDVQLVGPGDVVGINPRAVVRTEPRRFVTDFEPNYLPFIEFYDGDLPWRYTPARATGEHRLRPWISLLVLSEEEFELLPGLGGPLPAVRLAGDPARLLPAPDQTWGWAHVHVSRDVTNDESHSPGQAVDALEDLLRLNPDEAVSRLICPRRLRPDTRYHGLVVPTFEAGRRAGLGLATAGVDPLLPAWGGGQTDFPVYYRWPFGTGEGGDFELLVKRLEPREVDDRVGIRDMDVQEPGFEVAGMSEPPVMGLEGALRKLRAVPRPPAWPPDPPPELLTDLRQKVNLQEDLLEDPAPGASHPDPAVGPPLYGRWHAMARRLEIDQGGWVNELNRDPRLRTPAGFGTSVIQRNQEEYVARSWAQLGDILTANQRIRRGQLAVGAAHRLYRRNLLALDSEQLLATTRAVHARVRASPNTVHHLVRESRLPAAALDPAFRKITRPRGVVARKALGSDGRRPTDVIGRLNDGRITAAPPVETPAGQVSVNDGAAALFPDWIPEGLVRAAPWILLGLAVLLVLLVSLGGIGPLAAALAAVTAAFAGFTLWIRRRAGAVAGTRETGLTVARVESVGPRPSFRITEPGTAGTQEPGSPTGADSAEAARFRLALRELHRRFELAPEPPAPRSPLAIRSVAATVQRALDPARAIPRRISSTVSVPAGLARLRAAETIAPVMAHPVFRDPMYEPLGELSSELLIPNLDLIPEDTIALMETNPRFIESYMVGLNHEMARELLWRGFDTDQRGSYFRQFWDVGDAVNRDPSRSPAEVEEELRDVRPLHEWDPSTDLGTHENRPLPTGAEPGEPRLVLVIRGRLLKKYPTTVIFAQRAAWSRDETGRDIRILDESNPGAHVLEPTFKADVEPDVRLMGFDLTASRARGSPDPADDDPGWFFVLQERPGEPRFGLDDPTAETPAEASEWNELAWSHLPGADPGAYIDLSATPAADITEEPDRRMSWNSNSAELAYILFQAPVMVAFHADDMLG